MRRTALILATALVAVAGIIVAVALAIRGRERAVTVLATQTTTQTETLTSTATVSIEQAKSLNDEAYTLMQHGDFPQALTLATEALRALQGTADPYEAYANYNVGWAYVELGQCANALPYLDQAEALEGPNSSIDKQRARC